MANNPMIWDITLVDDDDKWYTIHNVELLNDIIDVNDLQLIEKPKPKEEK